MQAQLSKVHTGTMTFSAFAVVSLPRWQRLARTLLRRWAGPAAVAEEDLVQELLLGAWLAVGTWKPAGASLERYVVWQAMTAAKHWLHKQRGASQHGSRDRNPSRFDVVTFDDVEPDGEVEAAQERVVGALERMGIACAMLGAEQETSALLAIAAAGSVEGGAQLLGRPLKRQACLDTLALMTTLLED